MDMFEIGDIVEIKTGGMKFRAATIVGFNKSRTMVDVKFKDGEISHYWPEELGLVQRVTR